MPVQKKQGDQVFAGTINGEGSLEVRVTKNYSDTTLSKIIHLVEEAQSQKALSQRFVDVFANYYTPSVMALALLVFLLPPMISGAAWGVWFYRALVLLVIACPCASVISTPVSIVSGLTAMARRGVLIKGGAFLKQSESSRRSLSIVIIHDWTRRPGLPSCRVGSRSAFTAGSLPRRLGGANGPAIGARWVHADKLLRIDYDQQFGRFPVHLQVSLNVVGIPTIEHFQ
jgi:hypothetical protein